VLLFDPVREVREGVLEVQDAILEEPGRLSHLCQEARLFGEAHLQVHHLLGQDGLLFLALMPERVACHADALPG